VIPIIIMILLLLDNRYFGLLNTHMILLIWQKLN